MDARAPERVLAVSPGLDPSDLSGETGLALRRAPEEQLERVHWDTRDLRLARSGCALVREDDGFRVRLPPRSKGVLATRRVFFFAGSGEAPPAAALDLLAAHLRGRAPEPLARVRLRRRCVLLVNDEGEPQLRIRQEDASVEGSPVRFGTIAIGPAADTVEEAGDAVAERLRAAGATDAPLPELLRALGEEEIPAPEVDLAALPPDAPVGSVVRRAIAASLERLVAHDAGVRLGLDAEDVHQARVATRRLRSDLRTFHRFVDPHWAEDLLVSLRRLGRALGEVRDSDVLLERLLDGAARLPEADAPASERLLARLEVRRRAAHERALALLRSPEYLDLLETLVDAARTPKLRGRAALAGREALPRLVASRWRRLKRAVRALGPDPSDAELHEVRIRAKRCRYAAEAVAPVIGRPASAFAAAIESLQEVLGEHHDAIVAQCWLRDAARHAPPEEAFAAGELAAAERRAARAARAAWRATWQAAAEKKLRKWL